MPQEVLVVGVGIVSAVGLSAAETAASVRAGTARFAETTMMDKRFEPFVTAEVVEDGLPELAEGLRQVGLTAREARMLRLATPALTECLRALPEGEPPPGLTLALPETETTRPLDGAAFLTRLAQQTGRRFDSERSSAALRGRSGGISAIGLAADQIRSGGARFALAGGVDTYRDLYVLGTLDMEQRVKSGSNMDGFIPGEGAAFVLLASPAAGPGLARISAVSSGEEAGHLYSKEPYKGEGLALTVQQLVDSGAFAGPIQEVYSSMNGENHWAKEWGVTRIRGNGTFATEHGMHHPASSCGDTGAASGPLMVGLASLGLRQGYRRGPVLVYASSDRGGRAAVSVASG
jgi:3-oxoacyl-[acyl-carrier-protein] synthase-1